MGLTPWWKLGGARRAYGFTRLEGVTCVKDGAKVLIDVFDLANDEAAFGIFAANRNPRQPTENLGMAAQAGPRKAILAKARHYVEFAAEQEGGSAAELRAMASAMASRPGGRGRAARPPL